MIPGMIGYLQGAAFAMPFGGGRDPHGACAFRTATGVSTKQEALSFVGACLQLVGVADRIIVCRQTPTELISNSSVGAVVPPRGS